MFGNLILKRGALFASLFLVISSLVSTGAFAMEDDDHKRQYEYYRRWTSYALAKAHQYLFDQEKLDMQKAINIGKKGLSILDSYFDEFVNYNPNYCEDIAVRQAGLWQVDANISVQLCQAFRMQPTCKQEAYYYANRSILALEKIIPNQTKALGQDHESVWQNKFALFTRYLALADLAANEERKKARSRMKQLLAELKKSGHAQLYQLALANAEKTGLNNLAEEGTKKANSSKKNSKLEKVRIGNVVKTTESIAKKAKEIEEIERSAKITPSIPLPNRIMSAHQKLNTAFHSRDYESTLQMIRQLENTIYSETTQATVVPVTLEPDSNNNQFYPQSIKHLKTSKEMYEFGNLMYDLCRAGKFDEILRLCSVECETTTFIREDSLNGVYEVYSKVIGSDKTNETLLEIIGTFVLGDDLDGALIRCDVLKHLEIKRTGSLSLKTRAICAAFRNLNGDHEDFLQIEKELEAKNQKEKEKKRVAKERKRLQHAETIKQNQQAKLELENKAQKNEEVLSLPPARPSRTTTTEFSEYNDYSPRDTKEQQLARHQENERLRQEKAAAVQSQTVKPVIQQRMQEVEEEVLVLKPLRELYHLTGLALRVDREIEDDTWNFTREELIEYYKAMDCVHKDGKGNHKKVSLPKSTVIMQGENVVTILNDLGGALTLPKWEDTVPHYLHKQILTARLRLAEFKMKAVSVENSSILNNNNSNNDKQ